MGPYFFSGCEKSRLGILRLSKCLAIEVSKMSQKETTENGAVYIQTQVARTKAVGNIDGVFHYILSSPPLSTLLLIFVGCLFFYTIIIISIIIILLQHWFASCSFSFSFFLLFSQQYCFNNCFYAVSNEGREEKKTVDRMADLA